MKENYRENYLIWMNSPLVDNHTRRELAALSEDSEELMDRFDKTAGFGTSGIRAIMRAGTNGMNIYTIRRVSQGLAAVILEEGRQEDGVVIAYDSRHNSRLFAHETAGVLAANGIRVYIFDDIRPTPELSFALRELGAVAAVNITASHNPKEYNGYKVYWDDGSQLSPEMAERIAAYIEKVDICGGELFGGTEGIEFIGAQMDEAYLDAVMGQSVAGDYVRTAGDDFVMVYSAFHGAGAKPVMEVLRRAGIENITAVPEQLVPDGDFATVKNPNPEFAENYELAVSYADKMNADMIIGTDPDSDRCGAVVRTEAGWKALTGNQIGMLMLDYLATRKKELGTLPENGAVVKSVVSTALCERICDAFGLDCVETLTGFKFIGEKIKEFEETGEHTFVFGFEESIGFLSGTYTRDKDAVVAAMLLAEIGCYYESRGMSVYEGLIQIYEKYGYCVEKSRRIDFEGYDATERMAEKMNEVRNNLPAAIGYDVLKVRDFTKGIPGFPHTDMLYFHLDNGCEAVARPSGTEPVIKIYVKSTGDDALSAERKAEFVCDAVSSIFAE